jgi:hypothetical protein
MELNGTVKWMVDRRRGSNGLILRVGRIERTLGRENIPVATDLIDLLSNSIRTPKFG